MSTEKMSFKGKVKWCRPDQVNEWGKYSTRFYPDADGEKQLKELSIKNTWNTDDDGEYLNVSCPAEREFRGRKVINRVVIEDKEGNPHFTDVHGFIGDGSDVTLHLDYYDHPMKNSTKRGHAIKWTGLTIENLAPAYIHPDQVQEMPDWGEKPLPVVMDTH